MLTKNFWVTVCAVIVEFPNAVTLFVNPVTLVILDGSVGDMVRVRL